MKLSLPSLNPLFGAALCATLLTGLTSCQDEDYGYTSEQIKYAKNFTQTYGKIAEDKNWDLSSWASYQSETSTRSSATRSGGANTGALNSNLSNLDFEVAGEDYIVPANLMSWMKENLVEGRDNRSLGSSFMLRLPENDFAIIPIFQGESAFMSELELKVNNRNITKIWEKSQNIWAKDTEGGEWQQLRYFDGWPTYDRWYDNTSVHAASTLNAYSVKARPIIFHPDRMVSGTGDNRNMFLSLRNIDKKYEGDDVKWDANDTWGVIGDRLTSINSLGFMLALPVPFTISSVPSISGYSGDCHTMLIGCEDANGERSDHDNNDIVFLIVGYPNVPEIISTTETIKKRYMCEDLGATEDFDFNDIVIDVTQTKTIALETDPKNQSDNVKTDGNFELVSKTADFSQTARLAHVCGTLPFQVVVGNTVFPKVVDPTLLPNTREELAAPTTTRAIDEVRENGWNPNEVKRVEGWNPETNNIKIYVDWRGSQGQGLQNNAEWQEERPDPNITSPTQEDLLIAEFDNGKFRVVNFPKPGTVPYIIATDQDVPWMAECVNIPNSWVDSKTGIKDFTGAAQDQGNRLNKPEDNEEVTLWNGPFEATKQWSQGVVLNRLSEFHAAIVEAIEAGYNVVNVYTHASRMTEVGLSCNRTEEGWTLVEPGDAEGYINPTDLGNGNYKHTIYLTQDQLRSIKLLGLVAQARTQDGMTFDRITMTKAATKELTLAQARFGKIQVPSGNRVKWQGSTVPFEKAAFPVGTKLTLTAVPDDKCSFIQWSDGVTEATREITLSNDMNLSAVFNSEKAAEFYVMNYDATQNPIPVKFWGTDEKQDLNFESMKIDDYSHVTLVLDCDRWTENNGFEFKVNTKSPESVNHRIIQSEVADLATVSSSSKSVFIKTNANHMGKLVFEIWQSKSSDFDETQHVIVTAYIKKKSFALAENIESIQLSNQQANRNLGFTWIRQSKLNLSLKNGSGNVDFKKADNSNDIHLDAKKDGEDRLVINYTGSDHYLGFYREIPVTVSNYYKPDWGYTMQIDQNGMIEIGNIYKMAGYYNDIRFKVHLDYGFNKGTSVVIRNGDSSFSKTLLTNENEGLQTSNGSTWDGGSRCLTFVLSRDELQTYFQSMQQGGGQNWKSHFFIEGLTSGSTVHVENAN